MILKFKMNHFIYDLMAQVKNDLLRLHIVDSSPIRSELLILRFVNAFSNLIHRDLFIVYSESILNPIMTYNQIAKPFQGPTIPDFYAYMYTLKVLRYRETMHDMFDNSDDEGYDSPSPSSDHDSER